MHVSITVCLLLPGIGGGLVYWGLTPQQQPGSYQGGEMMMMKAVYWWRKPEYPEETTDLRQVRNRGWGGGGVGVRVHWDGGCHPRL